MTTAIILLSVAAVFWIALIAAVEITALKPGTVRKSDCMIVLGAKVRPDGSLSRALQYRCAAAAAAFHGGIAPVVIVCGGRGKDEPCTEADSMRAELMRLGVSGAAVITETESRNTRENLANAKAWMCAAGVKTCVIVTSDYHVARALWLARDLDMDACGVPAETARTPGCFLRTRTREAVSWILYFLRK